MASWESRTQILILSGVGSSALERGVMNKRRKHGRCHGPPSISTARAGRLHPSSQLARNSHTTCNRKNRRPVKRCTCASISDDFLCPLIAQRKPPPGQC